MNYQCKCGRVFDTHELMEEHWAERPPGKHYWLNAPATKSKYENNWTGRPK